MQTTSPLSLGLQSLSCTEIATEVMEKKYSGEAGTPYQYPGDALMIEDNLARYLGVLANHTATFISVKGEKPLIAPPGSWEIKEIWNNRYLIGIDKNWEEGEEKFFRISSYLVSGNSAGADYRKYKKMATEGARMFADIFKSDIAPNGEPLTGKNIHFTYGIIHPTPNDADTWVNEKDRTSSKDAEIPRWIGRGVFCGYASADRQDVAGSFGAPTGTSKSNWKEIGNLIFADRDGGGEVFREKILFRLGQQMPKRVAKGRGPIDPLEDKMAVLEYARDIYGTARNLTLAEMFSEFDRRKNMGHEFGDKIPKALLLAFLESPKFFHELGAVAKDQPTGCASRLYQLLQSTTRRELVTEPFMSGGRIDSFSREWVDSWYKNECDVSFGESLIPLHVDIAVTPLGNNAGYIYSYENTIVPGICVADPEGKHAFLPLKFSEALNDKKTLVGEFASPSTDVIRLALDFETLSPFCNSAVNAAITQDGDIPFCFSFRSPIGSHYWIEHPQDLVYLPTNNPDPQKNPFAKTAKLISQACSEVLSALEKGEKPAGTPHTIGSLCFLPNENYPDKFTPVHSEYNVEIYNAAVEASILKNCLAAAVSIGDTASATQIKNISDRLFDALIPIRASKLPPFPHLKGTIHSESSSPNNLDDENKIHHSCSLKQIAEIGGVTYDGEIKNGTTASSLYGEIVEAIRVGCQPPQCESLLADIVDYCNKDTEAAQKAFLAIASVCCKPTKIESTFDEALEPSLRISPLSDGASPMNGGGKISNVR